MTALLAVALFAPVLALPLARVAPTAVEARRWSSRGALAIAALWLVILLVDVDATFSRFGGRAAPAAIGTWLLVAAVTWPTRRLPVALAAVTAGVAVGGQSLLAGRGDHSDAVGALALAAVVAVLAARSEDDRGGLPAVMSVLGVAALALGVARDADLLALAGSAAVVVAAATRVRRVGSVLLPSALVLGAAVAHGPGVALALAAVACALARRPAASLGLWSLVAAASGVHVLLLGAAAVFVAVVLHPVLVVTAFPGAAVLATAVVEHGGRTGVALAVLASVTVALMWRPPDDAASRTPPSSTLAALALAVWLTLAPETWLHDPGLTSWGTGVVVALVGAAAGAFAVASFTEASFSLPPLELPDPPYPAGDPRWVWRVAPLAVTILGICGAALVASTVS